MKLDKTYNNELNEVEKNLHQAFKEGKEKYFSKIREQKKNEDDEPVKNVENHKSQ